MSDESLGGADVDVAEDPRYPVGRFVVQDGPISEGMRVEAMEELAGFPALLARGVKGLDEEQLGTPYREGGWTARQLVHHIADSHMTVFLRVRMALTEDWPVAKVYDQDAFVELADAKEGPVEWSVGLVGAVHARWGLMLKALTEEQWRRGYVHPEDGRVTLEMATLRYAWHGRHHLAQLVGLRRRRGW